MGEGVGWGGCERLGTRLFGEYDNVMEVTPMYTGNTTSSTNIEIQFPKLVIISLNHKKRVKVCKIQ